MNPENYGSTTIPRLIPFLEIVFGLLVPGLVMGPLLVFGLIFGIVSPYLFVLSACGAWGLAGVAMLFSDKISRPRAQVATAGVVAGSLVVLYLFIGTASKAGWHLDKHSWDKQSILLSAVLVGPTIVGLRKVILLWKNPPF